MPSPVKGRPKLEIVLPSEVQSLLGTSSQLSSADFDEMAVPTYMHRNPLARWIFWRRHRAILELADLQSGQAVLDFGTGTGALLPSLSASGAQVWATDLRDELARRLVDRRGLPVSFCDPLQLDQQLSDSQLDVIVAADVLEHIEEPQLSEYLRMFARKLRSQGRLIVSLPTENALYKLGRILAGYAGKGDYHRTGVRELLDSASKCGYRPMRHFSLPLPWLGCLFYVASFRVPS